MNKDFKNISFKNYLKFVLPTIFSMMFIAIYTMTDGIFVSNKLGSTALAALNITMPAFNFIFGTIFMIVVGASAIIGINLGAEEFDKANKHFTNMVYLLLIVSGIFLFVGLFFSTGIANILGSTPDLLPYAKDYLFILFIFAFCFSTKLFTEIFLRIEGQFRLFLISTIAGGLANILFDYVFMYIFNMGIKGAALGTVMGALVTGLFGIIYFASKKAKITLVPCNFDFKFIKDSLINGSSEMVSSLSAGITTLIFNYVLLREIGELGVSSISILLYLNFLLSSVFIGISMGIQPILSYNLGAKNLENIHKLIHLSLRIISVIGIVAFAFSNIFKLPLIQLFERDNLNLISITSNAMVIFSWTFLINGFNILGSGFFTAINNGKYSAIISFSRSIIFKIALVLTLPSFLGINGVWISTPISEILCLTITIYFYQKSKTKLNAVSLEM